MTIILPGDGDFGSAALSGPAPHGARNPGRHAPQIPAGIGAQDYGESLVRPIPAVREAAAQCVVDCSLHDATRAFDAFTQKLTSQERDVEKWPERFAAEAKHLRDRFAADIPDGPSRDRFDAGFDLFAKAKAVETRGLATYRRIATNRAELDRVLAGYGETISAAMNPVSADFAMKQGEEAIRNQVAAKVLSEDEGRDLSRRYRADIAARRARQFTLDDPLEAANELGKAKGGLFADLDAAERSRLAGHARQAAAAREADTARLAAAAEMREAAARSVRRDAFLLDFDDRAGKGEATLGEISAAARDGVLDADEAAARMTSLRNVFAKRELKAKRVFAVMEQPDRFLDPDDGDDRDAADVHWRDTVLPLVEELPEPERTRFEDAVILNTGIAPKPAVDGVLAGLLSDDPVSRVGAARRVHRWLLSQPPIPVDIHGLRIPEFETLRPYIDLPLSDVRKIELADRDREREGANGISNGFRSPPPSGTADHSEPFKLVDLVSGEVVGERVPAQTGPDTDAVPEASSPEEAQERLEHELAGPETRAALREQLLKDLQAEAE